MFVAVNFKLTDLFCQNISCKAYFAIIVRIVYKGEQQLSRNNYQAYAHIRFLCTVNIKIKLVYSAAAPDFREHCIGAVNRRLSAVVSKSYIRAVFDMAVYRGGNINIRDNIRVAYYYIVRLAAIYIIPGAVERVNRAMVALNTACKIRRQKIQSSAFAV